MKKRQRRITDLSNDVLKHILIHVAGSPNGPLNLARTLSICRVFRELGQDKMVLVAVDYNNSSLPLFHPSFWNVNGLVVRCMCIHNESAFGVERKYADALTTNCAALKRQSRPLILNLRAKKNAVEIADTRSRRKAFESATEKGFEFFGHMDDIVQKLAQLVQILDYVKNHISSAGCLS